MTGSGGAGSEAGTQTGLGEHLSAPNFSTLEGEN